MNAPEKTDCNRDLAQSPHLASWRLVTGCAGLAVLSTMLALPAVASDLPIQSGERLGTLLYSVAERSAITRTRLGQAEAAPADNLMTVNGVVKRHGGNSTVWINGQAVNEGQSLPPTNRTAISSTGATLDGQRVQVGETLERSTQARTDIVSPGAVSTRSPKAATRRDPDRLSQ